MSNENLTKRSGNDIILDFLTASEATTYAIKDTVLNWNVNPKKPETAEQHFITINDVKKQMQLLADLLDKNQLYVHLSEIEDETF